MAQQPSPPSDMGMQEAGEAHAAPVSAPWHSARPEARLGFISHVPDALPAEHRSMQAPASPATAAEKRSSLTPRVIDVLSHNRLSSLLSQQHLPLLASRGLLRRPHAATQHRAYSTTEDSSVRPIGRYPVPNKKDMPYDIVELMEEVEVKTGFLPNVFKAMSHRPAEFRAFFAYYNAIMNKETGRLSKADKELIIVATSAVNRCPYCVVAHGALHRIYSKQPTLADQVVVNWKLADLSKRDLAMLEFALAVCRADNITEEHFQKLEAHGFDREDAWDIATIAAFFAMSNRIAHFVDLRPNKEFYNMGRTPREAGRDGA